MKKIIFTVLLLCLTFKVCLAAPYSGTVTINATVPEGFTGGIRITMMNTDVKDIPKEDDPRTSATQVQLSVENDYTEIVPNLKGGKYIVMVSFLDKSSETYEKYAFDSYSYEYEIASENNNTWEIRVIEQEKEEPAPKLPAKSFWQIMWELIASTWTNSGIVIIALILTCIWYLKYKFDHFDKF